MAVIQNKVYAVGSPEVILPFRAGGMVLYPAETREAVSRALKEIKSSPPGSLILITEDAAARCPDEVRDFETAGRHALMIIPQRKGGRSLALERIKEMVIRSVGVDLISKVTAKAEGLGVESEEWE